MTPVARLSDLPENGFLTVKLQNRVVLLAREGDRIHAVDNRCPHMGFPLSKGTLSDGILTCHWHHARFDAASGCAFDLFADDIPSYDVDVSDGEIRISEEPRHAPDEETSFQRLRQGLEQNISLIQYKSIVTLLRLGVPHTDIIAFIADWGSANHEPWRDGMTLLAVAANLWPALSEENRILALCKASRAVAANCQGMPARRRRARLGTDQLETDQLDRWFRRWSQMRHRDGAERTLLTALKSHPQELENMIFGALHDRIYSDTGHNVDMANKALELCRHLGADSVETLLPLTVAFFTDARGEEDQSGWRSPVDLIPIARQAERALAEIFASPPPFAAQETEPLRSALLGDNAQAVVDALLQALRDGFSPLCLAREIAYLSALRLLQFPESNDIGDWFDPSHTFNYTNAVYRSIERNPSLDTARGLIHGALSVYQERFLNIPPAPLPKPGEQLIAEYADDSDMTSKLAKLLDSKQRWSVFSTHVAAACRAGRSTTDIIDSLAFCVLREDFDFHKLQVIEDAASQAPLWQGRPEAEHILAGAARHTAAHCPTPRAQSNMISIAQRLQKGDRIYEEDEGT